MTTIPCTRCGTLIECEPDTIGPQNKDLCFDLDGNPTCRDCAIESFLEGGLEYRVRGVTKCACGELTVPFDFGVWVDPDDDGGLTFDDRTFLRGMNIRWN